MSHELTGRRIVITRPERQAQEFGARLLELGAEVVYLPVIEIAPPDDEAALASALRRLPDYDWVIFTSVNGVRSSLERLDRGWPSGLKAAAIGPKTAQALQDQGIEVAYMPDEYVAEAIPPGLGQMEGQKFLLLRADLARPALAEIITAAGGIVDEVVAYRTVPARPEPQALDAIRNGVDVITFTSSSTVRNFISLVSQSGLNPASLPGAPKIACIGPITANTASKAGLQVDLVAETYTIEGLVAALRQLQFRNPTSL